jgi:integrase
MPLRTPPRGPAALTHLAIAPVAPVEYAVAVEAYLAGAWLSESSRRVYRISLTSWAWPLVGKEVPAGRDRRGAAAPIVPLVLLDSADAGQRLAAAVAGRAARSDARTVNRELSALRSAVGWWQDRHWIRQDPTAGISYLVRPPAAAPRLSDRQLAELFRAPPSLREHVFWRVLYETAAHVDVVLGLDAGDIDLRQGHGRIGPASGGAIAWSGGTARLLDWLLAGRRTGPVFVTGRRARAQTAQRNICPVTGRARMSYRRAAEIFTTWTRPLDPAGRGWTLQQLRQAGSAAAGGIS